MKVLLLAAILSVPAGVAGSAEPRLDVPIVRQSPQHCGPAALEMVLRHYGAGTAAIAEAKAAHHPALRGALITDLAAAARRAGYGARIARLEPDSLVALLECGIPPIVLYQNGRGPVTRPHYAVVTAWERDGDRFILHDGTARPRTIAREDLEKRWDRAGAQALIVVRGAP